MRYLALLLLASSLYGFMVNAYYLNVSNGRTTMLEFQKEHNLTYDSVKFGNKSYKVYNHPTDYSKMYALLPVNYYKKPQDIKAEIYFKDNNTTIDKEIIFHIVDGKYEKEEIKVDKSKVNPTAKDVKQRISKEYAQAMKIYNTTTKESYINSKFIAPMSSKITSDFGKARVYNDSLDGYHSGTDYRAKVGTPIMSSNDGVIVLVKDRFYSGGTVIINHGHGIYTCYYHMSRFDVNEGQKIKKGETIGLSGDSGRVTGPHLHFGVRVSGEQVDPLQFIELVNTRLYESSQQR